tara:strand:+ start:356 stop:673 length:318 start_codon:yes stop_codon:yes gene_type:complete
MEPYRTTMKVIIKKIGYDYGIKIVELEIPEDHIHMVIRSVPKQSPSEVIQIIKSIATREFSGFILKSRKNIFGEASCGRKVALWKRLEMQMKKQLENMFKASLLN